MNTDCTAHTLPKNRIESIGNVAESLFTRRGKDAVIKTHSLVALRAPLDLCISHEHVTQKLEETKMQEKLFSWSGFMHSASSSPTPLLPPLSKDLTKSDDIGLASLTR